MVALTSSKVFDSQETTQYAMTENSPITFQFSLAMCLYAIKFTPGGSIVNNIQRLKLERSSTGTSWDLVAGENPLRPMQTTGYQEFAFSPICSQFIRLTMTGTYASGVGYIAELRWGMDLI